MQAISSFLCFILFILVGWQTAKYATLIWRRGETSETLRIIYHPFVYIVAICCLLLAFILMIDFFNFIKRTKDK